MIKIITWGCVFGAVVACSSDDANSDGNVAGSSATGNASGATGGGASSGGSAASTGGSAASTGGSAAGAGGTGAGGTAVAGAGAAGAGGTGGATAAWKCPAGPFEAPVTDVKPARVAGLAPVDGFNDDGWGNVEGPVWIGDALYLSEIGTGANPPKSRVLKLSSAGTVSIAIADSGSNGLAVNAAGELLGAVHKDGSISKLSLSGGAAVPLTGEFMSVRFDSPNDLTVRSDGTIYFSDPDWQAPDPKPQAKTRLYRLAPGAAQAVALDDTLDQPNGVTLSLDEKTLYVSGGQLKKYPVNADGSLGASADFVVGGGGDGMAVDCAGNLYVAKDKAVIVYSSAGAQLGMISVDGLDLDAATNVAFGGPSRKTLFITGYGTKKGLAKVEMNVPGMPY